MRVPKLAIIVMLMAWYPTDAPAQIEIGLYGGDAINHLRTDVSNRGATENKTKHGIALGVALSYQLNSLVRFQSEPGFIQKNYSFVRTYPYTGSFQAFTNSYFYFPLEAELVVFRRHKFRGYFSAGLYGAYWVIARIKGAVPNIFNSQDSLGSNGQVIQYLSLSDYSERNRFDDKRDNRFEFGWLAGFGSDYAVYRKARVFLEIKFSQAVTDHQKQYSPQHNQTCILTIGGTYEL